MAASRNVDEFIAGYAPAVQEILQAIRAVVREEVPEAEEAIAYGIPTFRLGGKNLVHFSAFARHVGFYPAPTGIAAFREELAAYKSAKGSVQFPLDQPIPYALIRRITAFRAAEVRARRR
ncbi:MAG: DUF1801 domain-containing protein [Dehalococcoidia bacterium]|nr:DUF1801 domain-containing protein [Dehalococcoidia bacterium]